MSKLEVGQHIGNATVIERLPKKKGRGFPRLLKLQCDCGNIFTTSEWKISSGHTKSCGCYRKENAVSMFTKHGHSYERLSRIWRNMKDRCGNRNSPDYVNYGGRGIEVCKEWIKSFLAFYNWAICNGYSDKLSIDRVDNSKGYYPENCRWADKKIQSRNRRSNKIIEFNGEKRTLIEWCEIYGMKYSTVYNRLRRNWNLKKALVTPIESNKIAFKWR